LKLKIADKYGEVKNLKVTGQTYDVLYLSWKQEDVDAYLIKLVERVDHSYEKADYTSVSTPVHYILAIPN
jgi:septation ring formation regulator EzrA